MSRALGLVVSVTAVEANFILDCGEEREGGG